MYILLKFSICFIILLSGYPLLAQVGINTVDPETMLDVNGNLSLNAATLTLDIGDNSLIGGNHSFFNIIGPTSSFKINAIQPLTDVDGQLITLVNTTNYTMTIVHNLGDGLNSIFVPNENDLALNGIYTTVTLQYNKTLKRWMVLKYADNDIYQRRIYSRVGITDIETDLSTFKDMEDMIISFIPTNTIVYVNVSLAGNMKTRGPNNELAQGYGDFILIKTVDSNPTVVAGTTSLATDSDYLVVATSWNARLAMYPVEVIPGELTELKVQWRRDGQNPGTLVCTAESIDQDSSHRSITVFD